jgi:Fe-S-cluster containining protein
VSAEDQVREIWAEIPVVHCIGKCWHDCTVVPASAAEERLILNRHGSLRTIGQVTQELIDAAHEGKMHCGFLTEDHRCAIYDLRPSLCRMYGVVKGSNGRVDMQCPHGCKPAFFLNNARADDILDRLEAIEPDGSPEQSGPG